MVATASIADSGVCSVNSWPRHRHLTAEGPGDRVRFFPTSPSVASLYLPRPSYIGDAARAAALAESPGFLGELQARPAPKPLRRPLFDRAPQLAPFLRIFLRSVGDLGRTSLPRSRALAARSGLGSRVRRVDRPRAPPQPRFRRAPALTRAGSFAGEMICCAVEHRFEMWRTPPGACPAGEELDSSISSRRCPGTAAWRLPFRRLTCHTEPCEPFMTARSAGTSPSPPDSARASGCRRRTSGGSCRARCRRTAATGCGRGRLA